MAEGEGQRHCSAEVLSYLRDNRDMMKQVEARIGTLEHSHDRVIDLLENKLTELIDALRGKDMIPVSTMKTIVWYLLLFTFTVAFGLGPAKDFFVALVHH